MNILEEHIEQDSERERIEYSSGELRLYIKGELKCTYKFDSKVEKNKKIDDWRNEFRYLAEFEIGIILDVEY